MPTYLAKRGSTYYFRRVVPDGFRSIVGKREFVWSLKTKDRKEAIRRCHEDAIKTDRELERAENISAALPTPERALMHDVRQFALAQENETTEVLRYAAVVAAAFRNELEKASEAGTLPARREQLEFELGKHEDNLRTGSVRDRFSLSTSESMVLGLRALLTGEGAASLPPVNCARQKGHSESTSPSLGDLVETWAKAKSRQRKTVDMWKRTAAMFIALCGDIPVSDITKKNVIAFKDHLTANGNKGTTVQNRLNQLRSLFRFAVGQDILKADPSVGVTVLQDTADDRPRYAWPLDQMKALFAGPVHSERAQPLGGAGAAAYLLPLMALFTGARLNELGQLRPSDVFEEDYFDPSGAVQKAWVMRFVRDERDGLKLKSSASIRRIPVHPELQRLGFIALAEAARRQGHARIFNDLSPDVYGTVTASWSKWFSRYIRGTCGITDTKITFHSFRHSFKDNCRALSLPEPVQDAITGHINGSEARKYGNSNYPLAPMVALMDRYHIHNLVLPDPYLVS